MSQFSITVTDTDGSTRTISIPSNPKENLMQVLNKQAFDVPGSCGGIASCGTCHIAILEGKVSAEMSEDEDWMLDDLDNREKNSRLSCQIPTVADLDGLKIKVIGE